MNKTLVIIGIKHCGKSTQGKLLAKHYNCPFYDTDDIVTELTGKTPREIYTAQGEDAFMEQETAACQYLARKLNADKKQAIIATGGGICNNTSAVAILKQTGSLLLLLAEEEAACRRIVYDAKTLPDGTIANLPAYIASYQPKSFEEVQSIFHTFYEERTKKYTAIADVVFFAEAVSIEENSRRLIALCDTL